MEKHLQTVLMNNATYELKLEPFETHHAQILSSLLHSPMELSFLDLPASTSEFEKLAEQCPALESLRIALYRVITLRKKEDATKHLVTGLIGFHLPSQLDQTAVLGTWLGEPYRGLGINDLAKRTMISLAYTMFDAKRVIWLISTNNTRAIQASKKLPYVHQLALNQLESDLFAYKKWHDFKTGQSSLLFQADPALFSIRSENG